MPLDMATILSADSSPAADRFSAGIIIPNSTPIMMNHSSMATEIHDWLNSHTLSDMPMSPNPKKPDSTSAGPWTLVLLPAASAPMAGPTGFCCFLRFTETTGQTNPGANATITLRMCSRKKSL